MLISSVNQMAKDQKGKGSSATSAPAQKQSCNVLYASSSKLRTVPQGQTRQPLFQEQLQIIVRPEPEPSQDVDDDLVNFLGLAMVPKCYASLLEKACILHPELVICPEGSTPNWLDFAYGKLGALLFLLTSTRSQQREATFETCDQLRRLWEETKNLGFELSWLAPSLDSVRLEVLKKNLEENQVSLRCQMTTLIMQLSEAERKLADEELQLKTVNANLEYCHEDDFVSYDFCVVD